MSKLQGKVALVSGSGRGIGRAIALKLAGEGRWTPDDVRAALEARDRKACGPVAPPDGLYFMQVDYPDVIVDRRKETETADADDDLS